MIDRAYSPLSVVRQCELLGVSRAGLYYQPARESEENLALMRLIDEQYLKTPFYGSRQMRNHLVRLGYKVNRKRVQRLMALMGLQAVAPGPHTSLPHPQHKVYPYRLRGMTIDRPNQVWATDITYIPMAKGFMYLIAVMDWATRKVYVLAGLQYPGHDLLRRGVEGSLAQLPQTGDLQHRPGQPVHE